MVNELGGTPFLFSAYNPSTPISLYEHFIELGSNLNHVDDDGSNLVDLVLKGCLKNEVSLNPAVVHLFLTKGFDVSLVTQPQLQTIKNCVVAYLLSEKDCLLKILD